ncbi:MAG: rhombosortase [Gammaproteobacteria bacterium]|nr:rhombosortase [Gammaproteobacteria bacterium]
MLALASADVATLLSWDRMRLWDGQLWRLFTGHLVHANAWHVIINLTGLLLVILLFGNILNSLRWCALMGVAAVSVSVGLLLTAVWPQTYVGLSGVLHGLVAAPLVLLMRRTTLPVIALFVTLWARSCSSSSMAPVP